VRLEVLGQLKKSNNFVENRTRDLPVCSIMPQPTTLPRTPDMYICNVSKGFVWKTPRAIRYLNIVISPMGLITKNHCAGEGQQQFRNRSVRVKGVPEIKQFDRTMMLLKPY
jgi:hypothetical protein